MCHKHSHDHMQLQGKPYRGVPEFGYRHTLHADDDSFLNELAHEDPAECFANIAVCSIRKDTQVQCNESKLCRNEGEDIRNFHAQCKLGKGQLKRDRG